MKKRYYEWLIVAGLMVLGVTARAEMPAAVGDEDVDWAQCRAWGDGRELGVIPHAALGLGAGPTWATPPLASEFRYFRISFVRPVEIGTIVTDYVDGEHRVALLKPGAAGDVTDDSQWEALPAGPVKTLPAGTQVRALRFTHQSSLLPWDAHRRASRMAQVRLFKDRFWNPAQLGSAAWSGTKPDRWLGYWPRPLRIAAVITFSPNAKTQALPTNETEHATRVPAKQWQPFVVPMTTRAVQVFADGHPLVAPLVALGPGEMPPTSFISEPPFRIATTMPFAGFLAMQITDSQGRLVRRLVAEVARPAGALREPWDLRNDTGTFVAPGQYSFQAVARPPLRLTYEGTVYNAGVPPWYAPVPGGGGWLTDHNPPRAIGAIGDKLLIGGVGAEAGRSLAATDLEGRKVWDGGHLETQRLVSDGRYAYIVNDGEIIRLDPQKGFAQSRIFQFQYNDQIPGPGGGSWVLSDSSGVTCHDGRMYISYNVAPAPWIKSAVSAGEIDVRGSFPPVTNQKVYDTDYTPSERMFGAFLAIPSSTAAYFGDAVATGSMAHQLLLKLTHEVALGSVLIPSGTLTVHALKPGKELPAVMRRGAGPTEDLLDGDKAGEQFSLGELSLDPALWQPLETSHRDGADVAVLTEGMKTKALLFQGPGLKRLDYGLLLNRRYRNAAPDAHLVALEGQTTPGGAWQMQRPGSQPLSVNDPATVALVWPNAVPLRGLAVIRPMERAGLDIDVWTGPTNATVTAAELRTDANWRTVHQHRQNESDMRLKWHTVSVILADFGVTLPVKAVRIRIVMPPRDSGNVAGGFTSVVAFQPLGKDPVLPPDLSQRITELQLPGETGTAKVLQYVAIPRPTALAFDTNGVMYAACAEGIVRIRDFHEPLKTEVFLPPDRVKRPRQMLFDAAGLLYVLDGDSRQVIVFDPRTGQEIRRIGKPGGAPLGPWDPDCLADPSAMTLDANGKLWVVDQFFQPKRTARFTREGVHEKDLFGPTHYGGGGQMDAGDHTVINHLGMKFRVDYTNHTYRLEARLHPYSSDSFCPDRVTYWQGERYLIGDGAVVTPFGDAGPIAGIYQERAGVARPLVQVGVLQDWHWFGQSAELRAAFGKLNAVNTSFLWQDKNRDGIPQASEVQTLPTPVFRQCLGIGEDLSLNFHGYRLRPRGNLLYDVADLQAVPEITSGVLVNAKGETFVMGHKFLDAAGKVLWNYPDRYSGVQGSMQVPWGFYNRPPGVLAGSGWFLGQLEVGGEELFCVNANQGDYFAFTKDGLLAAAILGGPSGYGKRFFSMPEAEWGKTDLSDLRATVEDFHGYVGRAEDGHVYAIAGKTHITIIRVDGLEQMKRLHGTFTVTAEDVRKSMAHEAERASEIVALRPPRRYVVPFASHPPEIDGQALVDWPAGAKLDLRVITGAKGEIVEANRARLAFDANNLYVYAEAASPHAVQNAGTDKQRIFQYGDGVDINLGLDPQADPKRTEPVAGDVRLVLTRVGGKPVVMLYRYHVTGPRLGGEPVDFSSPVGETHIDEVVEIKDAKVAFGQNGQQWTLEAAIPWKSIGAKAPAGKLTLSGDIGILVGDPNGVSTVERFYWANTSLVIMSDLPAEARVHPQLWGTFVFNTPDVGELLENASPPSLDLGF